MVAVFYISGHGFGHASRDIEVLNAIGCRRPDLQLVVKSVVAPWIFELAADVPVHLQQTEVDTGMAQIDSLHIDHAETAARAVAFYATFERRVADEADALRELGAGVVAADIPPLAFAAAKAADVPSVALGNFTWDWIYEAYSEFNGNAAGPGDRVLTTIREAYRNAAVALRLPLHGGFAAMADVTRDIPFIARRSHRDRHELRRTLRLGDGPVVLASFGGHALAMSYDEIARRNRCTIAVTDHEAGAASGENGAALRRFDSRSLKTQGIRYEDLVAACDVVVSKPGYGIVSECIANDTALLYTSRGRFPEQDVFVAEMPQMLRCRPIPRDDLLSGRWDQHVERLLAQPPPALRPRVDGAEVAASAILEVLAR